MLGIWLVVWDMSAHSDEHAETESSIRTSAPDVLIRE